MEDQLLFSPYQLKDITLANRMVMAPMTRSRSDNDEKIATELTAKYYEQRASAGLIITEGTFVSPQGIGYINVPSIYTPQQVEGWKKVTQAVHEKGGKIFAQIWHVGAISHPNLLNGQLPVAPSAVNPNTQAYTESGFEDTVTPKAMTIEEIKQTVQDFKKAAQNALEAGFDGIELHAANGYLFHQFFSKTTNLRTDEYGGSIENRARFLFEVLEALKEVISYRRVGIRLNPTLHGILGATMDEESIPTFEYIVNKLNDYDLAYLHLTESFTPIDDLPFAIKNVAKHFRPLYNGTLIINKSFDKEKAIKVLEAGDADLVAFGVPFIANPDLVERYKLNAPLNEADSTTFYTAGEKGYTDYPTLSEL